MVWYGMEWNGTSRIAHLFASCFCTKWVDGIRSRIAPGFFFHFFSLDVVVFARTLHTGAAQGPALSSRIGSTGEVLLSRNAGLFNQT